MSGCKDLFLQITFHATRNLHYASLLMPFPLLYEINTRCWLRELSEKEGTPITLANVPDSMFATWQQIGFTHIWLMGVWTSGPRSRVRSSQLQRHETLECARIHKG